MKRFCGISNLSFAILVTGGLSFSSCSSGPNKVAELELNQAAWVGEPGTASQPKKIGEIVSLNDKPMFIEAPGHVGVLIIPQVAEGSRIKVTLKPIETWGGDKLDHRINQMVSELLFEVAEVQSLMAARKTDEALVRIDALQIKYPRVLALQFLRASCLIADGQREKATALLKTAASLMSDDPNAKKFYEAFFTSGMSRTPASSNKRTEDGP